MPVANAAERFSAVGYSVVVLPPRKAIGAVGSADDGHSGNITCASRQRAGADIQPDRLAERENDGGFGRSGLRRVEKKSRDVIVIS